MCYPIMSITPMSLIARNTESPLTLPRTVGFGSSGNTGFGNNNNNASGGGLFGGNANNTASSGFGTGGMPS